MFGSANATPAAPPLRRSLVLQPNGRRPISTGQQLGGLGRRDEAVVRLAGALRERTFGTGKKDCYVSLRHSSNLYHPWKSLEKHELEAENRLGTSRAEKK
jgi:hypothetical protein